MSQHTLCGDNVHCVPPLATPPGPFWHPSNQTTSLEGDSVNAKQGTWGMLLLHSGERLCDETGGPGTLRLSAKGMPECRRADAGTLCVDAQAGRRRPYELEECHASLSGLRGGFVSRVYSVDHWSGLCRLAIIRTPACFMLSHLRLGHPCFSRPIGEPLSSS
jgi:hypothetical protein